MSDEVVISEDGAVLLVTLNRAAKKNALTPPMYAVLAQALTDVAARPGIRAVVLRAEGRDFTAGNDISTFVEAAQGKPVFEEVTRFLRALLECPKPLVAAVQGRAIGVGLTMLLHCDHVLLAEGATLSAPFVSLGVVPEAGSSVLLPARIGHARAFAVFALGQAIAAAEALGWGLANAIVPGAQLHERAVATAHQLAAQPAGALQATKALLRDVPAVRARIDHELQLFSAHLRSPEAQAAFAAFAARSRPVK